MSDFRQKVLEEIQKIPRGETRSYGQIAAAVGRPGAARAVGRICAGNQDREIPCHRVVRADGTLGKYNGLRGASKAEILAGERE